jgi:hypothetical protein
MASRFKNRKRQIGLTVLGLGLAFIFAGCSTETIQEYEATALTTLTWRVHYTNDPIEGKRGRFESFASDSLLNRNGQKPEGAVVGPDDRGLWWSKVPPKPSLDEIEARQKRPYEKPGRPELLRNVDYHITYSQNGQTITLPTNHAVYRQVAKAYPQNTPLRLTFGINQGSVEKAEPVN